MALELNPGLKRVLQNFHSRPLMETSGIGIINHEKRGVHGPEIHQEHFRVGKFECEVVHSEVDICIGD
ncbi:hypothetical protein M7I_7344 [Glarea lozoyensis 74030]|uniref:Uncharacterized protein n=1 Tax=Glarea lozoyensis (strain ATCC 74030 / MF5533) TaxID=1104152 RepID=H0EX19_GLAL7|nr:hypothetical protein M7I_7344 [Glarea lozoyensis 74030]